MFLDGRTAVVTGGNQGIGQAICADLAQQGADVAVADLNEYNGENNSADETLRRIEATGQRGISVYTDVSDEESVKSSVAEVLDEFGSVDILVNNAGIAGPTKPCEQVSVPEWIDTMSVNLLGQFLMCREVLPGMKDQEYGRIVNIASITGKEPLKHRLPYATSKMGVIGLTRTLAVEVGQFDINVNAICPGAVDGPRMEKVIQREAEATETPPEEVRRSYRSESARNTLITRDDVANFVSFLCSESAENITGQDINVDAGTIME